MKKTLTAFCAATVAFLLALNAKAAYTDDCITFSSGDMFTLRINNLNKGWNGTLWTSTDKIQWVEWNGGAVAATQKDAVGPYSLHVRGNASNTKIHYHPMFDSCLRRSLPYARPQTSAGV